MPFLLYLLALAVFAQGTSEFVLAGLLPAIAAEFGVPLSQAGLLTSAFAAGMVIGAPLMAVFGRKLSPRWTMTGFLVVFVIAHIGGAITTSFSILVATRIISALANAGFLAVALATVTRIVPTHQQARAVSVILSGTTLALIAGVPLGSLVGEAWGWRATLWTIALTCLPALIAVLIATPARPEPAANAAIAPRSLGAELSVLRRRPLQLAMILAILVNAATFCTFTYLAVIATEQAGLRTGEVPVLLALFGIGAFVGVTLAGRFGDRHWRPLISIASPLLLTGWLILALAPTGPILMWILAFTQGALSFTVGSALIARVMAEAHAAPTMSGAFSTTALNLGAIIGPIFGGTALHVYSVQGVSLISALLVALALLLWWASAMTRRVTLR